MARVKGAMMTRKRRNKTLKLAKGYWGNKSQPLQDGQPGRDEVPDLRLYRPQAEEARFPLPVDHPHLRRLQDERHELLHLHARSEGQAASRSTARCSARWRSTTPSRSPLFATSRRTRKKCKRKETLQGVSFFMTKEPFSTVENDPFETPRERKGCALDLPSPVFYEAATARAVQNTACNAWRGFRFGLLLAAAAALRRGFGATAL